MKGNIKFISALILTISLIGCNQKSLTNDDFDITVDKEVTEDGNFEIAVDFKEGTPELSYKLYLDDKIEASGVKKKGEKDGLDMEFKELNSGEHTFKIEVEADGEKYDKEVRVKVDTKKSEDSNDENNVSVKEGTWDKESKEYSIGDKVSFEDKNYECILAHTSQEAWTPKDSPSLWKAIK